MDKLYFKSNGATVEQIQQIPLIVEHYSKLMDDLGDSGVQVAKKLEELGFKGIRSRTTDTALAHYLIANKPSLPLFDGPFFILTFSHSFDIKFTEGESYHSGTFLELNVEYTEAVEIFDDKYTNGKFKNLLNGPEPVICF